MRERSAERAMALLSVPLLAANEGPGWLVDTLYGSGKINTVIAVVGILLVGLFLWMAAFDRRLRKLEKK